MNLLHIYTKESNFSTTNKDFKVKTQEKQENNSKSIRKQSQKKKKNDKTFGTIHIIYYLCRCYENRHYYSITRDAGGILQ